MADDPFDEVFGLEEKIYNEGYSQGLKDGAQAGRIEGRSFGMTKGFEKFVESGRLAGKSLVWLNRLPQKPSAADSTQPAKETTSGSPESREMEERSTAGAPEDDPASSEGCRLPPLPHNPRLEKNVRTLYALVEPDTFSTDNSDAAVQDFDDRFKRAQGKAKIVERMIK